MAAQETKPDCFSTFGDKFYPGREMKIKCRFGMKDLGIPQLNDRFRIAFLKRDMQPLPTEPKASWLQVLLFWH